TTDTQVLGSFLNQHQAFPEADTLLPPDASKNGPSSVTLDHMSFYRPNQLHTIHDAQELLYNYLSLSTIPHYDLLKGLLPFGNLLLPMTPARHYLTDKIASSQRLPAVKQTLHHHSHH